MEKITVSIREASEITGLPQKSIAALVKDGTVKGIKIGTRTTILRSSLDNIFNEYKEIPSGYKKMSQEQKDHLKSYKKKN